jgi:D-3-phosphoglycerate dehydrogenase
MNNKNKILISSNSFAKFNKAPMEKLVNLGFDVIVNPFGRKMTKEELKSLLTKDINGLLAGLEIIDREILTSSGLKVISRNGVGMDNIDLEAAKELGIIVKNTPGAPTSSVAELTIGAMIALIRNFHRMDNDLHGKKWNQILGTQLKDKTILIIGFGRIGRYVAKLLRNFDVKLMAVDPIYKIGELIDEVPIVSLEEGLLQADIITLHPSGNKPVLIKKDFDLMKQGVFLLNSARGRVIEETNLIEYLKNDKIAGVWLDVFWDEPYNGIVCDIPNVLMTPHAGAHSKESRIKMDMEATDNLIQSMSEI